MVSAPKAKRMRRTGCAGRLLSTSQLIQRSDFEVLYLVIKKIASATETEPLFLFFIVFSYF